MVTILSSHTAAPGLTATRLLHYAIFLQGFTYKIVYRNTLKHANVDFFLRFPLELANETSDACNVFQIQHINTVINVEVVAEHTKNDKTLTEFIKEIEVDSNNLNKQGEYTLVNGCLMRGIRVVIPDTLKSKILTELHLGHLGIVKMKGLARSYIYWKGIDKDIEQMCKSCKSCANNQNQRNNTKPHPWENPKGPWERIHIDFAGPMNGKTYLIIIDSFSKWPEVYNMKTITSTATIERLIDCFSRFGLPSTIVSDNGRQFVSEEFAKFMKDNGIKHVFTAPYYPASNGQAERYVHTIKRAVMYQPLFYFLTVTYA